MQDTKLIRLLKTFNKTEYKQFGEFLHSPFVEKTRHLITLHSVLGKYHPNFNSRSIKYELIFAKMFQREKYNYTRLNNIISQLYRSAEKFIAHLRLEKEQDSVNINLLKELLERKLMGEFEKKYKKVRANYADAHPYDDTNYKIKLDELKDDFVSIMAPNTGFKTLQERFESYLEYALNQLISYYTRMYHENRESNFDYDKKLMDEIIEYLTKIEIKDEMLKINYKILMLEKFRREDDFKKLRRLVPALKDKFSFETLERIYLHLHGYCAWQAHANVSWDYYRESFIIIKEMVEVGTVNTDNTDYMDFLNVVKMGVSQNEFNWVNKFIKKFSIALPEDIKEDVINFAYGNIEYVRKNYLKALDYFARCNFKSPLMKVQVKILVVKMHYETGNYEQMLSAIDSFRHYLKREKDLTKEYKDSFRHFLSYTDDLAKIKYNSKTSAGSKEYELKKVTSKIEEMNFNALGVKVWLQNKCKDLK